MPNPGIDDDAHGKMIAVRDFLKAKGQQASLSDAIREMYRTSTIGQAVDEAEDAKGAVTP